MAINRNKVLSKAQKFVQQGKLQKAVDEYQLLVDDDPSDVRTLLKVGDLYSKMGNIESAIETYKQVASHYSRDGFFLKAVAVYKQMLKLDPSSITIYTKLAELYHQLGLTSEAMKQYQIVAKHYETKGMKQESLEVFKKMAELDPNNLASRVKLAELYAREGQREQAIEDFTKIAVELKEKGNNEDLIKVYEKIVKIDGGDVKLIRELASLYLEVGEPKRALAKLQVCFKTDPKDEMTLSLLARAFNDLQQPEKAKAVYTELYGLYQEQGASEKAAAVKAKIDGKVSLESDDDFVSASSFALPQPDLPEGVSADDLAVVDETKLVTDIDVYIRYGLADKAFGAIKSALQNNPDLVKVREKLLELCVSQNMGSQGAKLLSEIISGQESLKKATEASLISEILTLDPENSFALERMQGVAPSGESAAVPMQESSSVEPVEELSDEQVIEDDMLEASSDDLIEEMPGEVVDDIVDDEPQPIATSALEPEEEVAIDLDESEFVVEVDDGGDALELSGIEMVAEDGEPVAAVSEEVVDLEQDMLREPDEAAEAAQAMSQIEYKSGSVDVVDPMDLSGGEDAHDLSMEFDLAAEEDDQAAVGNDELSLSAEAAEIEDAPSSDATAFEFDAEQVSESSIDLDSAEPIESPDLSGVEFVPESSPQQEPATPAASAEPVIDASFASDGDEFSTELEEARFFLEQGLTDEVKDIVTSILAKAPNHPAALELAQQIGIGSGAPMSDVSVQQESKPVPAPAVSAQAVVKKAKINPVMMEPSTDDGGDLFDLAEALKEEISDIGGGDEVAKSENQPEYATFDEVLTAFKAGVAEAVSEEETEAHYDLGIAYKEMGLMDEAINEFKIAAKDERLRIEALSLLGLCLRDRGEFAEAVKVLEAAIGNLDSSDERLLGLRYDLGEVFVAAEEFVKARDAFKEVYAQDKAFRDVSHKMKEIAEKLEGAFGDELGDEEESALRILDSEDDESADEDSKDKKNKISYL